MNDAARRIGRDRRRLGSGRAGRHHARDLGAGDHPGVDDTTGAALVSLKSSVAWIGALGLLAWLLFRLAAAPSTAPPISSDLTTADRAATSTPVLAASRESDGEDGSRRAVVVPAVRAPDAPTVPASGYDTYVSGALLDQNGEPIRNADSWVSFTDANGRAHVASQRNLGGYALRGIPFGSYWISARTAGHRSLEEPFELDPARPYVEHDLHFRSATVLSVFVRDPDGRNLHDTVTRKLSSPALGFDGLTTMPLLIPVATRESPGAWIFEVEGSANNRFGVGQFFQYGPLAAQRKEGSIGVVVLDVDLPVYVSLVQHHAVLQSRSVEAGAEEVEFVIPADALTANLGTLTMRLLDSVTREPLTRPTVLMAGGGGDFGARGGSDGVLTIRNCTPGSLILELDAEGHERLVRRVEVAPGRTTDLGDILLDPSIALHLHVFDGDGQPCSAVFELLTLDPGSAQPGDPDASQDVMSNEEGEVLPLHLGRRSYVLRTTNHGAESGRNPNEVTWVSGNVSIDLRGGAGPVDRDVRLRSASSLVLRAPGYWSDGLRYRVTDARGLPLVTGRFHGGAARALALPEGTYRVELLDVQGPSLSTRSVTLGPSIVSIDLSR